MTEKFIVHTIAFIIVLCLLYFGMYVYVFKNEWRFGHVFGIFAVAMFAGLFYAFVLQSEEDSAVREAVRNAEALRIENKRIADAQEAERLAKLKDLEDTEYAKNKGRMRAEVEHLEETMKIYIANKKRGMDMEAAFSELTRQRDFENMKNQSKLLSDYVNEFKAMRG